MKEPVSVSKCICYLSKILNFKVHRAFPFDCQTSTITWLAKEDLFIFENYNLNFQKFPSIQSLNVFFINAFFKMFLLLIKEICVSINNKIHSPLRNWPLWQVPNQETITNWIWPKYSFSKFIQQTCYKSTTLYFGSKGSKKLCVRTQKKLKICQLGHKILGDYEYLIKDWK